MNTSSRVILSKTEYNALKRQAEAYRKFAARFFETAVSDPVKDVVSDFRKTGLYTKSFLKDIESGLKKSSYLKKYAHKAIKKRS